MAPKILKDGTVLSFDTSTQSIKVLRRASILIVDDRIAAIEENSDDLPAPPGDVEIVDVAGKIISPGFVNTHVHVWESVYRSMGPNTTLPQYMGWAGHMGQLVPVAFTADDIYISSLQGYIEGLNAGVTSVVEHAHNNWSRAVMEEGYRAAVDSGARVWWCYDVMEREGFSAHEQWDAYGQLVRDKSALVSSGLSLDGLGWGILNGDGKAVDFIRGKKAELDIQALTVHHCGGPWPQGNTSPTRICADNNLYEADLPIIFSHSPFLTDSDKEMLREHKVFISITPESECHYGIGQETGHEISDQASLGIDTNWTFSGDIIGQARLWLQLTRLRQYTKTLHTGLLPNANPMAVEQAFLLATRQGGRALRRDDIGVITVGAKADLVVFNGDSPSMLGWSDPIAAVILHANAGDIEHVLVDGEWKKKDFKLVSLPMDWKDLRTRFLESSRRIQPQFAVPPPLPEKFWGTGRFGDVESVSTIYER
ncbi:uncharacterized protein DSM5745_07926 [Aspergillus mulundensis]|uniref:Amidohydrolase-related domain-containing protein n=1 Tax=Aspergillus mulundensis TaxID=1810919 RepID=A0A3D8RFV6_9EURO|nr:hypothetical protein DSM5745_07926 [Aspergillus mulundensis]RDW72754.1 hypothetical protein DSM5745_07926 [Aspergillus mulundensis]